MASISFSLLVLFWPLIPLFPPAVRAQTGPGRIGERIEQRESTQRPEYVTETIQVNGITRTYLLHTPPSPKKRRRMPLVLVFHGGGTPPQRMVRYTGMSEIGDREGFIVVYPQGTNNYWNDGREKAPQADDVAFIRVLIGHLKKNLTIDHRRIYAAGFSNGGIFTQRLACELSGTIASIASLAASMPANFSSQCKPTAPISVLIIHGTDDPLVPYLGGQLSAASTIGGSVWSVEHTIKYWAAHNRCPGKPATNALPDKNANDNTRVRSEKYLGCSAKTNVVLYIVEGGGHTWPGANQYLPERVIGRTSMDLNGSEVIWDFFKQRSIK